MGGVVVVAEAALVGEAAQVAASRGHPLALLALEEGAKVVAALGVVGATLARDKRCTLDTCIDRS